LTPTIWAITCLLDSCLIGNKVYRGSLDGAVISCLFCLLPVIVVVVWGGFSWENPSVSDFSRFDYTSLSAIGAGIAFSVHIVFYFRTLYRLNDVSGAETFIALSVLIVPLFAWLLLDEILPTRYYVAFILAAAGVALQCLSSLRKAGIAILCEMVICVVAISLSMVLQAHALQEQGFAMATITFNSTCLSVAAVFLLCNRRLRQRVINTCRNYPWVLVAGEILGVLALVCSHRAMQMSPSVSLVALIECLLPLLIVLISFLLIALNRFTSVLSKTTQKVLTLQMADVPTKVTALALLMISVTSLSF